MSAAETRPEPVREPENWSPTSWQSFPALQQPTYRDLEALEAAKAELSQLYGQRWNVELDLRNIKTTMGMEVLHCQTPEMNEKELWAHLLAYNLIRLLMAQAATDVGVDPRSLSFKHTVQLWTAWNARGMPASTELFVLIAQIVVGNRPGRIEPRQRKRRPKPYPWLKTSRAQARADILRYGRPLRPK